MRLLCATFTLALFLYGCGSSQKEPAATPNDASSATGSLLPLAVGNVWTYRVTDPDGTISSEVESIPAREMVGGTGPYGAQMAFRLVTGKKANDPNGDVSWQAEVDSRVVRFREISIGQNKGNEKNETFWDPPRLRLDESVAHIADKASWSETFTEYGIDVDTDLDGGSYVPDGGRTTDSNQETWTVVASSQQITVDAGTFDALAVRRTTGGGSLKNFWFARGVGLIRQSQEGKPTHELSSYRVSSP